jgi:hypothetical protein
MPHIAPFTPVCAQALTAITHRVVTEAQIHRHLVPSAQLVGTASCAQMTTPATQN